MEKNAALRFPLFGSILQENFDTDLFSSEVHFLAAEEIALSPGLAIPMEETSRR